MKLAALASLESFALLGSGFGGDRWTLLSGLREASGPPTLVYASFEAPGSAVRRFVAERCEAAPGVWAVWLDGAGAVRAEPRAGSRLRDGMPTRLASSPVAGAAGPLPKPASPCPYDAVRTEGVATLLTTPDGTEIYEASVAAVLGWDGRRIVCVPPGRPRVWSTAEQAVREHMAVVEAPILTASAAPLLLVNAVKGTCAVDVPGREAFPADVRWELEHLFESLTADG